METRIASFQCSAGGMIRHVLSPGRLCKLQAGYRQLRDTNDHPQAWECTIRARSAGRVSRRPEIHVVPSSRVLLR
jgi:hypothetical protein